MKRLLIITTATLLATGAFAQKKAAPAAAKSKTPAGAFSKTAKGLQYRIVKDAPGTEVPKEGEILEVHLIDMVGDSTMFNSRLARNNEPLQIEYKAPSGNYGDVMEVLSLLTIGDSVIVRTQLDTFRLKDTANFPKWIKPHTFEEYRITLVGKKTREQAMTEMQAKMKEMAGKQVAIDEQLLQDYFTKNNLKPTKTASGLYYVIDQQGTGNKPNSGDEISVNYTGRTLDGKVFDSNVEESSSHKEPFKFSVGKGMVISGWDEGLMLMNKGAKGRLFIPSGLAYGPQSPGAGIQPNSVLIFDVTVLDITPATK